MIILNQGILNRLLYLQLIVVLNCGLIPLFLSGQHIAGGVQGDFAKSWVQFNGKWNASFSPFVHFIRSNHSEDRLDWKAEVPKIELDLNYTRGIHDHWSASLGYQWKINAPLHEFVAIHTFYQYMTFEHVIGSSEVSHRFHIDERLLADRSWVFRPRYSISWNRPLKRERAEAMYWYFTLKEELIYQIATVDNLFENRWSFVLGRKDAEKNTWEFGMEHRYENVLKRGQHKLYLLLSHYF